ncbi:MAG: hypothetical protein ACI9G1_000542 [Pirellulaceae bacterium]|jgi:hypothetical protein
MHSRELLELSGLIAIHCDVFIQDSPRLSENGLERYWAASKCRLQRWHTTLTNYHVPLVSGDENTDSLWQLLLPTIEEIAAGEVLTRVWTAIAGAHDLRHGQSSAEPVARNVWVGHLEVRNRMLNLLLLSQQQHASCADRMNRLRSSAEKWTDILLAYFAHLTDVSHLAFDITRTYDFAKQLKKPHARGSSQLRQQAVFAALRSSFHESLSLSSPNADLNQRIASSIMATFRPLLFDSLGTIKSLLIERVQHTANDTQGMIDELLALDSQPVNIANGNFGIQDSSSSGRRF